MKSYILIGSNVASMLLGYSLAKILFANAMKKWTLTVAEEYRKLLKEKESRIEELEDGIKNAVKKAYVK